MKVCFTFSPMKVFLTFGRWDKSVLCVRLATISSSWTPTSAGLFARHKNAVGRILIPAPPRQNLARKFQFFLLSKFQWWGMLSLWSAWWLASLPFIPSQGSQAIHQAAQNLVKARNDIPSVWIFLTQQRTLSAVKPSKIFWQKRQILQLSFAWLVHLCCRN